MNHPQKAIVTLTDSELGDELTTLRWTLRELMTEGVALVVVDVSEATRLSSTVLATLLETHRDCRRRGGGVVIRHAGRKLTDLLHRSGLDRVFDVEAAA